MTEDELFLSITRGAKARSSVRTKGKIIDAQYEISVYKTEVIGPDPTTAKDNVDGLMVRPGFTITEWITCQ